SNVFVCERDFRVEPCRIDAGYWVVPTVVVEVGPFRKAWRVGGSPSAQPGRIVPGVVIAEAALLIPLPSAVAISLEAHLISAAASLERRRSVWMVLLVRDQRAILVELDARRSEVVSELVPLQRHRAVDGVSVLHGLSVDECN